MFLRITFATLTLALGAQAQCPEVPSDGCSICGDGKCVTAPSAVFTFPGQPTVPCNLLQTAGLTGEIPLDQCAFLPALVAMCECGEGAAPEPELPNIIELGTEAGDFGTLLAALDAADLTDTLESDGPFTVFAPVDEAFASLPTGVVDCLLEPQNLVTLKAVLLLHVVGGQTLSGSLSDGMLLPTLNGEETRVDIDVDGNVFINSVSQVVSADNLASNGVVHVINNVILPVGFDAGAFLTTCGAGNICPSVPSSGCSICGPGFCVGNPDAVFSFPGQPSVPCGTLEEAGIDGTIPLGECGFLPGLTNSVCECTAGNPFSCPDVPEDGCSICGDDMCITNPDAIFTFPGQPTLPCSLLQKAGLEGTIPLAECAFLPALVEACGCANNPTPAPTVPATPAPVPVPTPEPVASADTPAPVVSPTPAPVVPPTPAPVVPPTPEPVAVTPEPTPAPILVFTPAPVSDEDDDDDDDDDDVPMSKKQSKKKSKNQISKDTTSRSNKKERVPDEVRRLS